MWMWDGVEVDAGAETRRLILGSSRGELGRRRESPIEKTEQDSREILFPGIGLYEGILMVGEGQVRLDLRLCPCDPVKHDRISSWHYCHSDRSSSLRVHNAHVGQFWTTFDAR